MSRSSSSCATRPSMQGQDSRARPQRGKQGDQSMGTAADQQGLRDRLKRCSGAAKRGMGQGQRGEKGQRGEQGPQGQQGSKVRVSQGDQATVRMASAEADSAMGDASGSGEGQCRRRRGTQARLKRAQGRPKPGGGDSGRWRRTRATPRANSAPSGAERRQRNDPLGRPLHGRESVTICR